MSRFWWWWFNHHDEQETRRQAQARADEAARQLVALAAGGQDVLLVAHGFINFMIGRSLARLGWRCVQNGGFSYWSARRFEIATAVKYRAPAGPPAVAAPRGAN